MWLPASFKLPVWPVLDSYQAALVLTEVFVFERLRDLGWNPDSPIPVLLKAEL